MKIEEVKYEEATEEQKKENNLAYVQDLKEALKGKKERRPVKELPKEISYFFTPQTLKYLRAGNPVLCRSLQVY